MEPQNSNEKKVPYFNYPLLFQFKNSELIVEFTGLVAGTVITDSPGWSKGD